MPFGTPLCIDAVVRVQHARGELVENVEYITSEEYGVTCSEYLFKGLSLEADLTEWEKWCGGPELKISVEFSNFY